MSPQHAVPNTENSDRLMACPSCSQEMRVDDDGALPLHTANRAGFVGTSVVDPTCPGSYGPGQPSRSGQMIRPPYGPSQIDERAAMEALESRTCWNCGEPKRRGLPFDKRCFKLLPFGAIGVFLNLSVGEGFEKAFAAALEWLAKQRAEAEAAKGNLFFDPATSNASGPPNSRV